MLSLAWFLLFGSKCGCSNSMFDLFEESVNFIYVFEILDIILFNCYELLIYIKLQISSRNLDRVRKLKSAMTRPTARVQKVC
jgi:hypothetical protein